MKNIVLISFLIFTISFYAQNDDFVGVYKKTFELNNDGGVIDYKLTLNVDGTFLYYYYRKLATSKLKEDLYGKGIWEVNKKNVLFFYTTAETDLDEKYSLDFTGSKARYITKSPRDKSDRDIKTNIRFYDTELKILKGIKLFKVE